MVYIKTYIFDHFYKQYLVIVTMAPRNSHSVLDAGDEYQSRRPSTHLLHDELGEVFCLACALILEGGVLRLAREEEQSREPRHLHLQIYKFTKQSGRKR